MTDDKKPDPHEDEKTELTKSELNDTQDVDHAEDPDNMLDHSKVKFISNGGADAQVDLGVVGEPEFIGLTKEELMPFAKDPFWVRMRIAMIVLFWLAWVGMLGAAIAIIVVAPRCPPRPDLKWWQKRVVYQAYPRSFLDTDADGVGDLTGVRNKLSYLAKRNATVLWLNPIYPSPNKDFGYDVSDYVAIDPTFGSMEDFKSLLSAAHGKGIKVVLDFVPNHSSDNHTWFLESKKSSAAGNKYADYYVWRDGPSTSPPNNWKDTRGNSAWTYNADRQQWYYHQYLPAQPDLNLRNPKVVEELNNALKFWLEMGVDGFRMDAVSHLVEANTTADEPASGVAGATGYKSLDHVYTANQPESFKLVADWRRILDQYSSHEDKKYEYRVLIAEVGGTPNQTEGFYEGADMPLNFALFKLDKNCNGKCVHGLVDSVMKVLPAGKWANWVLGSHDKSRVGTRVGANKVNAANMLSLLLPGTATTYYGEEIGMLDGVIAPADVRDWKNRDPERTPMQWSADPNAGFSTAAKTWLPVNADYKTRNVAAQLALGAGHTNIDVYTHLTLLRQEPSFQWGLMHYAVLNDNIFSFVRQAQGFDGYLVAINFGKHAQYLNYHNDNPGLVPPEGVVAAVTDAGKMGEEFPLGEELKLSQDILLREGEGFVVKFPWNAKND